MFPTLDLRAFPRRLALAGAVALAVLALDFVLKELATAFPSQEHVFNPERRSFLGLGDRRIWLSAVLSAVVCILPTRVVAVGAGLAFGGALGNLASHYRFSQGTPDFLPLPDGSTGNPADLAIAAGTLLLLAGAFGWLLAGLARAGKRARPGAQGPQSPGGRRR